MQTDKHLHCDLVPRTAGESIGERRVIGDKKKMRRTQEKFLEAMQESAFALNLHVWSRRK